MIKENVFRLEIPIDDTVSVETSKSFNELSCIKTCSPLAKLLILSQVVEKLATVQEIHDEVELGWRLESIMKLHNEWTINLLQDVSLSLSLNEEIPFGYNSLGQLLHGVKVICTIPSH